MGNLCLGGKTRRKNYREEKIWGKDGAKPPFDNLLVFRDLKLVAGVVVGDFHIDYHIDYGNK